MIVDQAWRDPLIRAAQARAAADVAAAVVAAEQSLAGMPEYVRGFTNDGRYPRIEPKRAMAAGILAHIKRASA